MTLLGKLKEAYKVFVRGDANVKNLVKRGMTVGDNFQIQGECKIDSSHAWLISIGNNVTIAPRVHILAHDASTKKRLGYTRIGLVDIGDNVFVGADSVILPGVRLGGVASWGRAPSSLEMSLRIRLLRVCPRA